MVSDERMATELGGTLDSTSFVHLGTQHRGKVRDSYIDGGVRTIVTTDRQSAFDRLLGTMPFKGQALNEIANFWFEATATSCPNHLLEVPDPNVVGHASASSVALEFVVRAYITGVTKPRCGSTTSRASGTSPATDSARGCARTSACPARSSHRRRSSRRTIATSVVRTRSAKG